RDLDQHPVARLVTELIVYGLESIQIDQQHCQRSLIGAAAFTPDAVNQIRHGDIQRPPVAESCESIGKTDLLQHCIGARQGSVSLGELARALGHFALQLATPARRLLERMAMTNPYCEGRQPGETGVDRICPPRFPRWRIDGDRNLQAMLSPESVRIRGADFE